MTEMLNETKNSYLVQGMLRTFPSGTINGINQPAGFKIDFKFL